MADRPPNMSQIRLPWAPLERLLEARAVDAGVEVRGWLIRHPRGGLSHNRMRTHCRRRGWITAATADRWAVQLLGLTLDEIYGPDWDTTEVAA